MPQMAPYNWLNLFFLFNFLMIYLMTNFYFINFKKNMNKNLYLIKYIYMWKW